MLPLIQEMSTMMYFFFFASVYLLECFLLPLHMENLPV